MCSQDFYSQAEFGSFLPYTSYPCLRAIVDRPRSDEWAETMLFDLESDYNQQENLTGIEIEQTFVDLLVGTMKEMDAPNWQFERVGLANQELS